MTDAIAAQSRATADKLERVLDQCLAGTREPQDSLGLAAIGMAIAANNALALAALQIFPPRPLAER